MTVKEVKKKLLDKGLTISEMARELSEDSDATFDSIRVMLTDLLYGRRYFPELAAQVNEKWGIEITRNKNTQTVRQALKQVA
jgi:hypothetical protein